MTMNPTSWIRNIFSETGADIIKGGYELIDELHTSTEEKLKLKVKLENQVQESMQKAEAETNRHSEAMESELTERLRIDMSSDSWLSKNIRPLVVATLTVGALILAGGTILNPEVTPFQQAALNIWVPFFTTLMVTVYGFYFCSRGIEKVQKLKLSIKEK